jgi:hypothetical protein
MSASEEQDDDNVGRERIPAEENDDTSWLAVYLRAIIDFIDIDTDDDDNNDESHGYSRIIWNHGRRNAIVVSGRMDDVNGGGGGYETDTITTATATTNDDNGSMGCIENQENETIVRMMELGGDISSESDVLSSEYALQENGEKVVGKVLPTQYGRPWCQEELDDYWGDTNTDIEPME